jgi:hypothetical protein
MDAGPPGSLAILFSLASIQVRRESHGTHDRVPAVLIIVEYCITTTTTEITQNNRTLLPLFSPYILNLLVVGWDAR